MFSLGPILPLPYFHRRRCFDVFVVLECTRMHTCGEGWAAPGLLGPLPQGAITAQSTKLTSCHGPPGVASKTMLNSMSFFDRCGVDMEFI